MQTKQEQQESKRVFCLYRVSTKRQIDENEIPMQKNACRDFCFRHGWSIVHEAYEKGISGYVTDFQSREAIKKIKQAALAKEYDLLLVFMFDRVGRKVFEVPALFQWLVERGVSVWSTQEGEQRFDTEADIITAMLRGISSEGESRKLGTRVRTKHMQMAMAGDFRGGTVPYGYRTVDSSRIGREGNPIRKLEINESEAPIIRMLFDKLVNEQKGVYELSSILTEMQMSEDQRERTWRATTIRALLSNRIYIGQMHFGEALSMPFEHLRIISNEMFQAAQARLHRKKKSRSFNKESKPPKPSFYDILFCAHCGGHLVYNSVHTVNKAGGVNTRYIYRCYNKLNYANKCTGQTTYTKKRVDELIRRKTKTMLQLLTSVSEDQLVMNAMHNERARNNYRIDELRLQVASNTEEIATISSAIIAATQNYGVEATTNLQLLYSEALSKKTIMAHDLKIEERLCANKEKMVSKFYSELSEIKEACGSVEKMDEKQFDNLAVKLYTRISIGTNYTVVTHLTHFVSKFFANSEG